MECDNCLCNLERCKAECCKLFLIRAMPHKVYRKGMVITFKCADLDMQHYYRLHNIPVVSDNVFVTLNNFKVVKQTIFINERCKYLDKNNMCLHHSDGLQPKICAFPNKYKIQPGDNKKIWLTPNCVYKEE